MARARNIKPGFFKNEDLAECSAFARLCFVGLWTMADREGRLEDRPKRIKGELFPYESVEVDPLLDELVRWKFIARYEVDGVRVIQVLEFVKHQTPHFKEAPSTLPSQESPGLDPHSMNRKPEASPSLNDGGAPTQPGLDPHSRGGQNPLNPESGFLIPDSGLRIPDAEVAAAPSIRPGLAGTVCMAMKQAGIQKVNPSHPDLLRLIAAGVSAEEFADAAADARVKNFAYVLTAVEGRRNDAAAKGSVASKIDPDDWTRHAA